MSKQPRVSILIPTYNYAGVIEEAIKSALAQTFTDYEIIIVDDQSTDNTAEVVGRFLCNPRIRFYKNEKNIGLVANFNKCLEYANGEYIKYLLADDKLNRHQLERFVSILDSSPSVSIVTSYSEIFGEKNKTRTQPCSGMLNGRQVIYETLKEGKGNWIGEPTTVMFRKKDVEKVGGFSSKYTCLTDFEMWLRLLTIGDLFVVNEVLSSFRVHKKQASNKLNVKNWFDEYNFYKDVLTSNNYKLEKAVLDTLSVPSVLKDRATYCAKGMFRLLPHITKENNRRTIKRAFNIAKQERVLWSSFKLLLSKQLSKI